MALITHSVPGLYNGVSQQPHTVRHATQAEVQENAFSSLVAGLIKRPPSEHIKVLGYFGESANNAYVHLINRDETERYVVLVVNGTLKVYDMAGTEKAVSFPNGAGYLATSNPKSSIKLITIADYSFLVNSEITVAMLGTTAPGTVTQAVQTFDKLPGVATEGSIYEIVGDPESALDSYFVKRTGGVYLETVKPGALTSFNAATMPHVLIRQPNGTFVFQQALWNERGAGDALSSPVPSFVGNTINELFFHRNRLGLVSRENIIFSEADNYYNFWRTTVIDLVDSDYIDVSSAHSQVAAINHAVPFNKSLLLFSGQNQFVLTAGDVLTARTVKIEQSTSYEANKYTRPVTSGPNVYFVTDRSGASSLKEYYVADDTVTNDAADITKHAPTYVPAGVFKLSASSTEDVLFALSTNAPNKVFVYKFYWQGTEKKQSSWSVWTFAADAKILSVDMIGSEAYMVVKRPEGLSLERLSLQMDRQDSVGYRVHLDRLKAVTGTYSGALNKTTWVVPYAEAGDITCILGSAFGSNSGGQLAVTKIAADAFEAPGNFTAGPVYAGVPYAMKYTFSQQNFMQNDTAVLEAKIRIRNLKVAYVGSGDFDVTVTPKNRTPRVYPFSGRNIGPGGFVLGAPTIGSDIQSVPIQAGSDEVTIEITNDTPMPCSFQSAAWEAFLIVRSTPQ